MPVFFGAGGSVNVEITFTPLEQIEAIIDFVDSSVEEGTLYGKGPGNSAGNRFNSWNKMLERANSFIAEESYEQACEQLNWVYKRIDGKHRPPDFVAGSAVPELASEILKLIETLGCD